MMRTHGIKTHRPIGQTHRAKTRGLRGAMGSEPNQLAMSVGQKKGTGV